jgi:hypothetical protein
MRPFMMRAPAVGPITVNPTLPGQIRSLKDGSSEIWSVALGIRSSVTKFGEKRL